MSKPIQAYFSTESDAESARISLMIFNIDLLEVGELGDGRPEGVRFVVPIIAGSGSGIATGTGMGTLGADAGAVGTAASTTPVVGDLDKNEPIDYDKLRYVLSGKVREQDYPEIVRIIHRNKGHVQAFD
ncbi:hypothetical protein [Paenibacillus eucommiae]|uniref:Uncharacterized protein n=1 Tax=Paenibacillus eucommiae TaxID=1355755 RepID=A0ABS4IUZ3_9BACL|nr:hypothetical protein [Paenibacillus eucommiae]MBP1991416.1 hypothetical protein [Paenibacillus eucommiae]